MALWGKHGGVKGTDDDTTLEADLIRTFISQKFPSKSKDSTCGMTGTKHGYPCTTSGATWYMADLMT